MTNATSATWPKAQAKMAGVRFLGKFTVLKGAARELWIAFGYFTAGSSMVRSPLTASRVTRTPMGRVAFRGM
jgi:hypothetical protein